MIGTPAELITLALGSLFASAFAAVFGIGAGIIIVSLLSIWLPIQIIVPLVAFCAFAMDSVRSVAFRRHVQWRLATGFLAGAWVGVALGARTFFEVPESVLGVVIASIMLAALWLPTFGLKLAIPQGFPYSFIGIGAVHSFVSSVFAFGGVLQATVARLKLPKERVVATIAVCFGGMSLMKTIGYAVYGFDYRPYLAIVLAVTAGAIPGAMIGRRLGTKLSQRWFDLAFRLIVTAFSVRLLIQSFT